MAHYTRLEQAEQAFNKMIQRFGVVTVMNAKVWDLEYVKELLGNSGKRNPFDHKFADEICAALAQDSNYLCELDTLKTSNITQEGPTKTVTGGQNSSPLLKFGKTARLEMQDALGNAEALEALGGMTVEYGVQWDERMAVHATDTFSGPKTILGETFFIDQETGAQVDVYILIYQFLPDSIFNLSQDAEGDATVFDMNGDLISTKVYIGDKSGEGQERNLFYSICKKGETVSYFAIDSETGVITLEDGYSATLDGSAVTSGTTVLAEGSAARLIVKDSSDNVVLNTIVSR